MAKFTLQQVADACGGQVVPEFAAVAVNGVCSDSRKLRQGQLFIALKGARFDGHDYIPEAIKAGAAGAISAREMPGLPVVVVPDTLRALGDLARFYRQSLEIKVIGITGSVGKTTTKEMIAGILETAFRTARTEGNYNNNIGLPQTVLEIPEDYQAAVLELGMNHFNEMSYLTSIAQPDIAVITNIGTMHIEHLGSREGILQAKLEILEGLRPDGRTVFNGDEPLLWNLKEYNRVTPLYFGVENDACDVLAKDVETVDGGMNFRVHAFGDEMEVFIPAPGMHMVYNALAAISVGYLMGVKPAKMQQALAMFRNAGMRQEIIKRDGYTVIADCYNAGPESMEAALQVLADTPTQGRRIAVLGDMLELGVCSPAEHYRIGRLAAQTANALFTYGKMADRYISGAVTGGMNQKRVTTYKTHEELADALKRFAKPGDVLLFKGSRGMRMEQALEMFFQQEKK